MICWPRRQPGGGYSSAAHDAATGVEKLPSPSKITQKSKNSFEKKPTSNGDSTSPGSFLGEEQESTSPGNQLAEDESTLKESLYERLGGKRKIKELTNQFFFHIGKEKALIDQFFVNVPIPAIQLHQGKFFKVLFASEEDRCTPDELLDYMLVTHVRLFRDLDLNETHFDMIAKCFVAALHDCQFTRDQIDECLAIVGPLRVAFEYGAKVARQEKLLASGELKKKNIDLKALPPATMETMRSNRLAVLPPGVEPPPQSLIDIVGGGDREVIRMWTCRLTERFVVKDKKLRDTFAAIPYLGMEPYLHAFLQMAFFSFDPNDPDAGPIDRVVLRHVRFPLGLVHSKYQLTKQLFARMTMHFEKVGIEMMTNKDDRWRLQRAVNRLKTSYIQRFVSDESAVLVERRIGTKVAHALGHNEENLNDMNEGTAEDDDDDSSVESSTNTDDVSESSGESSHRRNLGRKEIRRNPIFAWLQSRRK